MKLTHLALDNRPFTVVVVLLLVVMGVTGYLSMPRSEDPYIKPPFATVYVILPGATPGDLESLVLEPLEKRVRDIDEVKHTDGSCRDGLVVLSVEFEAGTDQDEAVADLDDALAEAEKGFPAGVLRSDVRAASTLEVRVMQVALASETRTPRDLRLYAEKLEDRLERIPQLEEVEVAAVRDEEVRIALEPEKLASRNISILQVTGALESAGANIPGGSVTAGDRKLNVLTSGDFESLEQIRRVPVGGSSTSPLYLGEVAEVDFAYADRSHLLRVDGKPAVLVTARQKPRANILSLMETVREEVAEFQAGLPPDIELIWVMDQSRAVRERLSEFMLNLLQGVVLVGLVIFIALGPRPSAVVMLAIPLSFVIAIGFINMTGFAIQQMTIAALIIALGLLVDNGIVVTENINTHLLKGLPRERAARLGTAQVGWAIVAATVTTVLAYVPIAMMKDVSGDFVRSMPISVMIILGASLLVALTVSPLAASRILRPVTFEQQPRVVRALYNFVQGPYRRLLSLALRYRTRALAVAVLCFVGALALFPLVGVSFFPKAYKPMFLVDVELPEGSSLDATDRTLRQVESLLLREENIRQVSANLGKGQPPVYYNVLQRAESSSFGQILVQVRNDLRGEKLSLYLEELRDELAAVPGARIELRELEQGPGVGAPIGIRLFGRDAGQLESLAARIEESMREVPGLINIDNPFATRSVDLRVEIDRDKAALLGIPIHQIDMAVRTCLAGWTAAEYRDKDGEEYPVTVRLPSGEQARMEDLQRVYLPASSGSQVPLSEVARYRLEGGNAIVQTRDGQRMTQLTAGISGRPTAQAEAELRRLVDEMDLPAGTRVEFGGEAEARGESFSSMYQATSIAIIGIYAVLVLMFRSYRQPLIIYAALPLAFIGSVLALFLTGYTFSFTAFIGLTSLVGIVVNNSILLVDMTNQYRREGMSRKEAVLEAGTSRFVPIVLTSATTILGLLPLTLSGGSLWGPMGWVIIGGLLTSSVLTLLIVPVLYDLFAGGNGEEVSGERA